MAQTNVHLEKARKLFDNACIAKERGNKDQAVELLEQALSLYESNIEVEDDNYCDLVTALTGTVFENLKNKQPSKALAYSQKFLKVQNNRFGINQGDPETQADQAWQLYELGRICQTDEYDNEAYACFLQAIVLSTEPGYTKTMDVELGCLGFNRSAELNMKEKNLQQAERNCTVAYNSSEHLKDNTISFITAVNISALCLYSRNNNRARDFFSNAIRLSANLTQNIDERVVDSADSLLVLAVLAKHFNAGNEIPKLITRATEIILSPAAALKSGKRRLLDAANMDARAKVLTRS